MRQIILIALLSFSAVSVFGQITLERCKALARENYPVIRQLDLVEQSRDFNISNAAKGWLPQFGLSAKASYQSDATKLPVTIPSLDFSGLSRDQYDFSLNVSQNIYDGGAVSTAKKIASRQGDVDRESVNVALYDVYSRIEEIFFGILLLDENIRQSLLLIDDLNISLGSVESMLQSGVANEGDVEAVKVELISAGQTLTGQQSSRAAYLKMLSTFTGEEITEDTQLEKPASDTAFSYINRRPELDYYNAQELLLDERNKSLDTDLRPHLSLFLQGGYANPALNMFKTGFQWYYKVGATLTWNFGSLYTRSNDKKKIALERQTVDSNRAAFLLNTQLQSEMQGGNIDKLRRQIAQDDEIISLRESIRSKSEKKVENGTETVNEMLRDINAVSEACRQKSIHEVQLLQEIYKLKTINNI
ncbi:MAG: TolC family protein [Prevotella sp.]|nr:TolC family protein [Prevotella sp.]